MEEFNRPPHNQTDSYQSLSQFDEELQQQAQLALEQEMEAWKDFENYLPPVAYYTPLIDNNQMAGMVNPPNINVSQPNNSVLYNQWDTAETNQTNQHNSPHSPPQPFGSPDSLLEPSDKLFYAHPSPISACHTPSETPTNSPKADIYPASINHPTANNPPYQDKIIIQPLARKSSKVIDAKPPPLLKKKAHNVIERRYRNNINDCITELKNVVPALVHAKVKTSAKPSDDDEEDDAEFLDGVAIAKKLNKATILCKATEYILHLKRTEQELSAENNTLQYLLSQLPGGQDVLARYLAQKNQREQEFKRQCLQERAVQKHQDRKHRKDSKKRSRHEEEEEEDIYFSKDRISPPVAIRQKLDHNNNNNNNNNTSVSNRVFMAVFMAISLFSASPLSAGPTSKEQFENHNHISRTAEDLAKFSNSSSPTSYFSSLFPLSDGWSAIRSTVFAVCLIQLLLPMFRFWFSYGFIKVRRVNKKTRTATSNKSSLNGNLAAHVTPLTPGDQKCKQIYTILVKSLENEPHTKRHTILPQKHYSRIAFYILLVKEIIRFISRHWLGYEILYDDQNVTPQEQWVQACKWIKLNEVECLGGNPQVTRCSMLYSCFHMMNLIELMEDDENEYVEQSRSRVYATAALQMALVIPHHGMSELLSRYFWSLAMYESGLEDDTLMRALIFDCHEDDGEDRIEVMLKSRAWYETVEVMNQQLEHFGNSEARGLSLSMTAPVLLPVGILSTLHLLDNLQTQFGRLIISITAKPSADKQSDFSETAFAQLLDVTDPIDNNEKMDDYHRLAHWLSAVGATVEALWKSDTETAENLINVLIQKVPRSLVSREITGGNSRDLVGHKDRMNQLDELTKKSMIHMLIGSTLLKQGPEQQRQGVEELWKAEQIKESMKKIRTKKIGSQDLESSVLALAEFVTAVTGLEAWISAWRLAPVLAEQSEAWENTMTEQVRHSSLNLRRMIRYHSLDGLRTNQAIVERLTRLCSYVSNQGDEVDSACECSDFEPADPVLNDNNLVARRSEKALEILRGIS
ncbi:hypothetical protein HPULCUR_000229 [Helicostylum pulchrum]|uniref:BHLH domain-containing protein n=1 Tax=Helicostylum pulchrum TaxID=562976 RepID=A0ABP9XJ95_9FUNG